MTANIYSDIAERTKGDIYIGVVGPVRTGKSTFIKKFMENAVIPNIENRYKRERAVDELPQSAAGRSIMTSEPKFVPNEAIKIRLGQVCETNVRLIDSVGYMVAGAIGDTENDRPRMVTTPWDTEPVEFAQAAETGTKKVITEHSTIGILVTTDGSITEIHRENYVDAEERVVRQLKEINKPFVIVLNSVFPQGEAALELKRELEKKYDVCVVNVNVLALNCSDIENILLSVLHEFPVAEVNYTVPGWLRTLDIEHPLKKQIDCFINEASKEGDTIRLLMNRIYDNNSESINFSLDSVMLGCGRMNVSVKIDEQVFYKTVGEENGISISSESELFNLLCSLLKEKRKVETINKALSNAGLSGYGIIFPSRSDFELESPMMIAENGRFGIRLKCVAHASHIIKSDISAEISPMIGSEAECNAFYEKILNLYEIDPAKIWETEFFGRSVSDMMADSIVSKLTGINEETKTRLTKAVGKISNSSKGGLYVFWI